MIVPFSRKILEISMPASNNPPELFLKSKTYATAPLIWSSLTAFIISSLVVSHAEMDG
jgi:hypothetical protein